MSTLPFDSAARTSPLDMLAQPAPREGRNDDSFAQHFQAATSSPSASKEEAARHPQIVERKADIQQPRTTPAATSSSTAHNQKPSDEQKDTSSESRSDENLDHAPQPPVANAPSEPGVANAEDDEATEDPESPKDELLVSCLAPCVEPKATVTPTVEQPEAAEPEANEQNGSVVLAADEEKDAKSQPASKKSTPRTIPQAQQVPLPSTAASEAELASSDATDTDAKVDPQTVIVAPDVSAQALDQVTDATEGEAASLSTKGETSAEKKLSVKKPGLNEHEPGDEAQLEAAPENVPDGASASESVGIRPRDSKRNRQRSEARSDAQDKVDAQAFGKEHATTVQAGDAITASTATTATSAENPTRVPSDFTIPPPVTTAPATAVADTGAPQSLQRLPQHLVAKPTAAGNRGAPVNPAEQTRFVARVAKAFQTAQARGGELQLRLSPAELGSLKLEIKLKDGAMSARVEAENANAKSMLMDNLPVLKERLAEQGIVIEKFDVELMDRQPQGQPDTAQQRDRRPAPRSAGLTKSEDNTATAAVPSEPRPLRENGRLNVTA